MALTVEDGLIGRRHTVGVVSGPSGPGDVIGDDVGMKRHAGDGRAVGIGAQGHCAGRQRTCHRAVLAVWLP